MEITKQKMSEQAPNQSNPTPPSGEQPTAHFDSQIENSGTEFRAVGVDPETEQEFKGVGYLDAMPPEERQAIIDASVEITRTIPDAVIYGGNALRMLYEARTGRPMFGAGKGDQDIYVPHDRIASIRANPPEGYSVNTDPRFLPAEGGDPEGYVVLTDAEDQHIDVFGRDGRKSEVVEIAGQTIPILALEEQITDKLNLALQTNGFDDLPEGDRDRHGFYATRLLEMAEAGQVDETLLPPDWREDLRALAAQGNFAEVELSSEEESRHREKMEKYREIQEKVEIEQGALIAELQSVFETTHQEDGNDDPYQKAQNNVAQQPRINEYMPEAIPTIVETAVQAQSMEDFIASLRDSLREYANAVGERIRAKVA